MHIPESLEKYADKIDPLRICNLEDLQEMPRNWLDHQFNSKNYLYLGTLGKSDLYFYCAGDINEFLSTAIYVFGPKGSDYGSGSCFMTPRVAKSIPEYGELFFRLLETGFLTDKMVTTYFAKQLEVERIKNSELRRSENRQLYSI